MMRAAATVAVVLAAAAACASASGGPTCRDMNGDPVAHFEAFKRPHIKDGATEAMKSGRSFVIMDKKHKTLREGTSLEKKDHALYHTLSAIYDPKVVDGSASTFNYALYNDQGPFKDAEYKVKGKTSSKGAHMKGVVAFDTKTGKGFWLVHSTPRWPPPPSIGYDFPHYAVTYAQSYLCLTLDTKNINKVLAQLRIAEPLVHYSANPSGNKDLAYIIAGKYKGEAIDHVAALVTVGGDKFDSIVKDPEWAQQVGKGLHFYHDAVFQKYKVPLLVETWMRGARMADVCPDVKNIAVVSMLGADYTETHDHSKYAVSDTRSNPGAKKVSCIGGINRETTQAKRGGGTVCTTIASIHDQMIGFAKKVEDCPSGDDTRTGSLHTPTTGSSTTATASATRAPKRQHTAQAHLRPNHVAAVQA